METPDMICKYNQSGFCKYQDHCRKQHISTICQNLTHTKVTCLNRHPRICKFFASFGRCKFGASCAYLHSSSLESVAAKLAKFEEEQNQAFEKLNGDIVILKKEIQELRITVNLQSQSSICSYNIPEIMHYLLRNKDRNLDALQQL